MLKTLFLPLFVFAVPIAVTSCTASLDLERFKQSTQSETGTSSGSNPTVKFYDFRFNATAMLPHINEYFEIRIVNKLDTVAAKAVYFGITNPDFSMFMKRMIPKETANAPYRIDYWADHNNNGTYDGFKGGINAADHSWRRILTLDPTQLPEDVSLKGDLYELDFLHDTNFTDIFTDLSGNKISGADSGLPFNLNIIHTTIPNPTYVGKMIEVRVVEPLSGRLVALHRRGTVIDPYTAQVTGVLDEGTAYEVSVYVDMNGDQKYNTGEPSWKVTLTSDNSGITSDFDVSTLPLTPIDTGDAPTPP